MAKYYVDYDYFNLENTKDLYIISHFKTFQQSNPSTCAACCALMVLKHLNIWKKEFNRADELKVAEKVHCRPFPLGTDLKDLVNFLKPIANKNNYTLINSIEYKKNKDGLCFSTFKKFKNFVINMIKKSCPIIVENVDYGGHYKVIIGYDCVNDNYENDMLIFADPSDFNDNNRDGYSIFPAERFFYMWFDNHCLSEKDRLQPFITLKK